MALIEGMKTFHRQQDGTERELNNNAVDYHDGNVMVQYVDTDEIAIIPKEEIVIHE